MNTILTKDLRKYYHDIDKTLSCDNKEKKNIMESIKSSVECYVFEKPDSTIEDVTRHFGSPQDIAAEYNSDHAEEIFSKVKNNKKIAIGVISAMIAAFALLLVLFVSQIDGGSGHVNNSNGFKYSEVEHTLEDK